MELELKGGEKIKNQKIGILIIAMTCIFISTLGASSATDMTGNWSGWGHVYNSTAGPVNVTATATTNGSAEFSAVNGTTTANPAFFNNSSAADHSSLQATFDWGTIDSKNNGTITFTFNRPVDNPVLDIDRIGGAASSWGSYYSDSVLLTLVTPGLTLTKLSGPNHFEVTSTTIQRTPNVLTTGTMDASTDSTKGTASGSVMINGSNIISITFLWSGVGAPGDADEVEFIWELEAPVDLSITQTTDKTIAVAGQNLSYTINVTNNGSSTIIATDKFKVNDSIPSNFIATSFTPSAGSYNSTTGLWTGVTLVKGQSLTLTINGTVSSIATGILNNTVTVTVPSGITDTNLTNNKATISTKVDALPVAKDDNKTTPEDTPLNGTLPASDTDGPIAVVNFTVNNTTYASGTVNIPGVGTITVNANGTYTFIPALNYNGPVPQIKYTIRDSTGNTASANLNITVNPVNDVPVVGNYSVITDEDIQVIGKVVGSDVDGDSLTYSKAVDSAHGSVTVNVDGTWTYMPSANYNGLDSFVVTVSDGYGGLVNSIVNVTVNPVNDVPVVGNYSVITDEDIQVTGKVVGSDVDGDSLTYSKAVDSAHGSVTVNVDGTWTYMPSANYNGLDSFVVTVSDGYGGLVNSIVNVTVNPVNDVPVVGNYSVITDEDIQVTGKVVGSDVDGDSLTYSKASDPTHGIVLVNMGGSFTYTPNRNYYGPDSFNMTVNDGHDGGVTTTTIEITVTHVSTLENMPENTSESQPAPKDLSLVPEKQFNSTIINTMEIPMRSTGVPWMVMAVLMILGSLLTTKRE